MGRLTDGQRDTIKRIRRNVNGGLYARDAEARLAVGELLEMLEGHVKETDAAAEAAEGLDSTEALQERLLELERKGKELEERGAKLDAALGEAKAELLERGNGAQPSPEDLLSALSDHVKRLEAGTAEHDYAEAALEQLADAFDLVVELTEQVGGDQVGGDREPAEDLADPEDVRQPGMGQTGPDGQA